MLPKDSTLRSAAKARRTPDEILEYQSVDEKLQEISHAFDDEKNQLKAAEGLWGSTFHFSSMILFCRSH